jgi:hypothetical protein
MPDKHIGGKRYGGEASERMKPAKRGDTHGVIPAVRRV